jgi:hypothetical protein
MVRLVGVGIFLWGIYASMSYAWAIAPKPDDEPTATIAQADDAAGPDSLARLEPGDGDPRSADSAADPLGGLELSVGGADPSDAPGAASSSGPSGDPTVDAAQVGERAWVPFAEPDQSEPGIPDGAAGTDAGLAFPGSAAAKEAEEAAAAAAAAEAVVEELVEANEAAARRSRIDTAREASSMALRAYWLPGLYTVGDSPDPQIAARDRDVRPRTVPGDEEDRLAPVSLPGYMRAVQGELVPGTYATGTDAAECSYQLLRVMRRSREEAVIGEDYLATGRLLVTIDGVEPDSFTSTVGCGRWYRWTRRADPTAPAPNGDYGPGDLAPGLWEIPAGCLWEQVVAFRGAELRDVEANGQGPTLLPIDDVPLGLRLRSCQEPATFVAALDPEVFPGA